MAGTLEMDSWVYKQLKGLAMSSVQADFYETCLPEMADIVYGSLFVSFAEAVFPNLLRLANMDHAECEIKAIACSIEGTPYVKVIIKLVSHDGRGFGPYYEPGTYELTTDIPGIHGHRTHDGQHLLDIWVYCLTNMIRFVAGFKPPDAEYTD
jgi:hypothetical protein